MKIVYILFLLLPFIYSYSNELKGIVYGLDENGKIPLVGANIKWLGSNIGTLTDKNGKFIIKELSESNQLIVSYATYKKDTFEVKRNSKFVEINLIPNFSTNQVNVIGLQSSLIISDSDPYKSETITLRGLQKAACCNLSESFQTNPSVDVNYSDAISGAKQILLLGLHGKYSQLLNEKIPTMTAIASTFGLNYIPGPFMESIQISKGMSSVATGYESITGQINIEYKKPFNSDEFFINLYGSDEAKFEVNLTSALEVNHHLTTILMAHGSYNQYKIDHNGDGFLDIPLVKNINLYNRWWYQDDGVELQAGIKLLNENREAGQLQYFSDRNNESLYGIGIDNKRYEFFLKNGYVFESDLFRSLGFIFSAVHHNQNSFYGKKNYIGEQNSIYSNLIYQSEFNEKNKYFIGLSLKNDNIFENYKDTLFQNEFNGIKDTLLKRNELVSGVFTEYTYSGIDSLTIMMGLRLDKNSIYGLLFTPRLHLKYNINSYTNIRASVGKGYRTATIFAENSQLFASSRKLYIDDNLDLEKAINYGANFSTKINFFGLPIELNLDYYRTNFINQIIVDIEQEQSEIHFYNLKGESFSNSFQADIFFEPIKRFEIRATYRLNDVKMTVNNLLLDKSLISKHKGFINLAYSSNLDEWNYDLTIDLNGGGRIPKTQSVNSSNQFKTTFDPYAIFHSQITRKFDDFHVYIGVVNLFNYVQHHAILNYEQPFSKYFDSSLIWGPIMGRLIYLGIRYSL